MRSSLLWCAQCLGLLAKFAASQHGDATGPWVWDVKINRSTQQRYHLVRKVPIGVWLARPSRRIPEVLSMFFSPPTKFLLRPRKGVRLAVQILHPRNRSDGPYLEDTRSLDTKWSIWTNQPQALAAPLYPKKHLPSTSCSGTGEWV